MTHLVSANATARKQLRSFNVISERIPNVAPLGRDIPAAPYQYCPEALQPWLFGTPHEISGLGSSFALLDAARIPNLPELLETSDLPYRCLYAGLQPMISPNWHRI